MNTETLFSEKQRFTQIWVWLLLLSINWLYFGPYIKDEFFPDPPFISKVYNFLPEFYIGVVIIMLTNIFFIIIKLETKIKVDGIYVRFFPIHLSFKFYTWEDLDQCFVREYRPLLDYAGWGYRGSSKKRVLTVSGNKGIHLVMKDGTKLLIGTKKPDEVIEVLEKLGQLKRV
ncbi:DUF6141 family protein [Arcicella sp. DC2W]|uniref:DUF6141 family protein n=1 Tax=Arcicella gelida TaxID=2984195 RepID=A0ABU5S5M3_9BACT|nr:DUF6141 family protein [Arcicella sp. DC2W]MEA5403783.1 DUF6141 family protein [Arcicella sp. DC2W]